MFSIDTIRWSQQGFKGSEMMNHPVTAKITESLNVEFKYIFFNSYKFNQHFYIKYLQFRINFKNKPLRHRRLTCKNSRHFWKFQITNLLRVKIKGVSKSVQKTFTIEEIIFKHNFFFTHQKLCQVTQNLKMHLVINLTKTGAGLVFQTCLLCSIIWCIFLYNNCISDYCHGADETICINYDLLEFDCDLMRNELAQSNDYCRYGELCFQVRIDSKTTFNLKNTSNKNIEEENFVAKLLLLGRKIMRQVKKSSRRLA